VKTANQIENRTRPERAQSGVKINHCSRCPVNIPVGRGPFTTWEESARDAIILEGMDRVNDWNVPRVLYELEFNGFGYCRKGFPTPYLWSCTAHYSKGSWDQKGFNPEVTFSRCGAAPLLQALMERKLVALN
jgi:lysozyme family protein